MRIILLTITVSLLSLPATAEVSFKKQILTNEFVAEGCHFADFDEDGHIDITAGCYIWWGPDFSQRSNYTPESVNANGPSKTPYDPAKGYSDYFLAFTYDFDEDSREDILVYGLPGEPAHVFVNPGGRESDWEKHAIFDVSDGESPDLIDIDGDGKPELLVATTIPDDAGEEGAKPIGQLGYAEIDWSNPLGKARFRPITSKSEGNVGKYQRYTHGYGAGDVNGDGRTDILSKDGWFEQPAYTTEDSEWKFHPATFAPEGSPGGAQMRVYDVNGDGRSDVITSYHAHGFGLGWFEQNSDGSFAEHKIMGSTPEENSHEVKFSQLHATHLGDIDGDGIDDLVTGKRRWAHGPLVDVGSNATPVLYWFETKRDAEGEVKFIPHLVDDESGVGTQVSVGDLNEDGKLDIVVANKLGVFAFKQQ